MDRSRTDRKFMVPNEGFESIRPVPQRRIIEKMNEYMSRRDYGGAERHLCYWLEEALLGGDLQGQLMIRNELVGHYRKTGQREKAMENAAKALELLETLGMEKTISAGTTYVNAATACNAFGDHERSIALFIKAREAYENSAYTDAQRGQTAFSRRMDAGRRKVRGSRPVLRRRKAHGSRPVLRRFTAEKVLRSGSRRP